jgi:hypothetical protein
MRPPRIPSQTMLVAATAGLGSPAPAGASRWRGGSTHSFVAGNGENAASATSRSHRCGARTPAPDFSCSPSAEPT